MQRTLTVAQLNEYVRRSLAADPMLKGIRLRGEISNFKRHSAGHLYFTLKDEEARVACVMFRSAAATLKAQPRDGMSVVLRGSASLYAATGQYQFYVDGMQEEGIGGLYAEFERLKARLQAEGLFDSGLKKPLPLLPKAVGIVTSPTGAVLHDIRQVAARRHPGVQLVLRPALVQGEGAAADIARAIAELDADEGIDVIIVGRGGGSLEELWAFNEEIVARAVFESHTPIVSAVGHETDFTIADFVADVRAATPSAAAELAVPRLEDLRELVDGYALRLSRAQAGRLVLLGRRLDNLKAKLDAGRPWRRLAQQRAHVGALLGMMAAQTQALVTQKRLRLKAVSGRLPAQMAAGLKSRRMRLDVLEGKLYALSPDRVLERGYAVVTGADGRLLKAASQARLDERIRVRLQRGALEATITEVYDGAKKTEA